MQIDQCITTSIENHTDTDVETEMKSFEISDFLLGNVYKSLDVSTLYVVVLGPKHFGDFYTKTSWIVSGVKTHETVPQECLVLVCCGKTRFRTDQRVTDPNASAISRDEYSPLVQKIVGLMHVRIIKQDELVAYCLQHKIALDKNEKKYLVIGSKVRFSNPISYKNVVNHCNITKLKESGFSKKELKRIDSELNNVCYI